MKFNWGFVFCYRTWTFHVCRKGYHDHSSSIRHFGPLVNFWYLIVFNLHSSIVVSAGLFVWAPRRRWPFTSYRLPTRLRQSRKGKHLTISKNFTWQSTPTTTTTTRTIMTTSTMTTLRLSMTKKSSKATAISYIIYDNYHKYNECSEWQFAMSTRWLR